eukprot:749691-Hanusia_phi.AAC.2
MILKHQACRPSEMQTLKAMITFMISALTRFLTSDVIWHQRCRDVALQLDPNEFAFRKLH